ncbi:hypothetical protein FNU76_10865 [Chitinimonas arctica]|uniref:Leucine-rich repeat domain-containing protein n=1 Tax=Chitinimonas arctica TaxID=2594795 RepID=A0A516SF83_9NEIS|nr:hypothetical protein [Chitinimonas arctica]QDQ26826.1 hypothetical protein FNU76_10865 [Chitinimonas arctica]
MQSLPTRPPSAFPQPSGTANILPEWSHTLRRLQANDATLTVLNLSGRELDNERIDDLARSLRGNSSLRSLDLSHNRIGPEGARALSDMLVRNTSLVSLGLSHNPIGDTGVVCLSEALTRNRRLLHIILGDNQTRLPHPLIPLLLQANWELLRPAGDPAESTGVSNREITWAVSRYGATPIKLPLALRQNVNRLCANLSQQDAVTWTVSADGGPTPFAPPPHLRQAINNLGTNLSEQDKQLVKQGVCPASLTNALDAQLHRYASEYQPMVSTLYHREATPAESLAKTLGQHPRSAGSF